MLSSLFNWLPVLGGTKMVLVVRNDISMGTGKVAAQCAHAAVQLYDSALSGNSRYVQPWMFTGQPKIVLKIERNCVQEMESMHAKAIDQKLNTCLIYDAGRTQIEAGTLTVLGIGPNLTKDIDLITRHLKLL